MAYTAYRTWVTGEIVTAAQLNEQLRDNGLYVKGVADTAIQRAGTIPFTADQPMGGFSLTGLAAGAAAGESVRYEQLADISVATAPARALTTIYQNSTKPRFVVAIFSGLNSAANGSFALNALSDAATPPTAVVASRVFAYATNGFTHQGMISFFVLPSHYYRITSSQTNCGVPNKLYWVEWDLH